MSWEFETDPEFQEQLDWIQEFVAAEVEPLEFVLDSPFDFEDPARQALIPPLQQRVKDRGLWACHLGPELGGKGYGQVKLALINEIIGRAICGPVVFGAQAPDTGNSEILAHFGTEQQKRDWLEPLLENRIVSCFSMTEPHGGADPKVFTTEARLEGDEWVLNGEKWFSSNARYATFLIVMAVTEPEAPPYQRQSMFIVPVGTPGVDLVRDAGMLHEAAKTHGYIRYTDVRIPAENLLGARGEAFAIAQTRLGGGRIHHAMRTVGLARRALDMMCERALARVTQGEALARKQLVQEMIADSWTDLESFRLFLLRTAWRIDKLNDYRKVRGDISAVKARMPKVLHDLASRAVQIHGSLGVSDELPLMNYVVESYHMGMADGPTEVHKLTAARQVLAGYQAGTEPFTEYHLPTRRAAAEERYAPALAGRAADG